MEMYIDISGQVTQINYDSCLGCTRSDGLKKSVFLRHQDKKEIIKKYKGKVVRLVERIHCILIYYCIKDILEGVEKIIICKYINYRSMGNFLSINKVLKGIFLFSLTLSTTCLKLLFNT